MVSTNSNKPTYEEYIEKPLERFDQKNEAFKRARWDDALVPAGKKFYGIHEPQTRPGFTRLDYALHEASWYLERGFARGTLGPNYGLFSWQSVDPKLTSSLPEGRIEVQDPLLMARQVKKVAKLCGADLVGICAVDPRWFYSHIFNLRTREHTPFEPPTECTSAIVMAHAMDYEMTKSSPTLVASSTTGFGYSMMAYGAGLMGHFLRGLGYKAIPCGNDTALSIPLAVDAGLGELGRNGLLITEKYGPRVRLSKVFTDLPLAHDKPVNLGVQAFCETCKKCASTCSAQAILDGDRITDRRSISNNPGMAKWPVDAEKCFSFWSQNGSSCMTCIRACPFNKVPGKIHDMTRWTIKKTTAFNKFFVWVDDLFDYGKKESAAKFWEE
ncbi:MAG: reductive dehalogenase [Candidatus Tectomicrobia bacterium]|nr:reductive dehalogenase [Candidatus Tectomicrobia bacterium]